MITYGCKNGVNFRINHSKKLSNESLLIIDKLVHLTIKSTQNDNRQTLPPDNKDKVGKRLE